MGLPMGWESSQRRREYKDQRDTAEEREREEYPEEYPEEQEEQPESKAQTLRFKTRVDGNAFLLQSVLGDESAIAPHALKEVEERFAYEGGRVGLSCYVFGEVEVMPGENIVEKIKYKSYELASNKEVDSWYYNGGFDQLGSDIRSNNIERHIDSFTPKQYQVYQSEGIGSMINEPGYEGKY
jgi:hypothetical protein